MIKLVHNFNELNEGYGINVPHLYSGLALPPWHFRQPHLALAVVGDTAFPSGHRYHKAVLPFLGTVDPCSGM